MRNLLDGRAEDVFCGGSRYVLAKILGRFLERVEIDLAICPINKFWSTEISKYRLEG